MSQSVIPAVGAVVESEDAGRSALATLPAEWVQPVAYFALAKLYLLKTRGPLVANLRYWISKGLTLDDAKAIFRRLCDPDVASRHHFENEVMADLAALVADALRRHRVLADMQRRRESAFDPAATATVKLADLFAMPFRPVQE